MALDVQPAPQSPAGRRQLWRSSQMRMNASSVSPELLAQHAPLLDARAVPLRAPRKQEHEANLDRTREL
eukprot:7655439-Pyramimonas_sp.AAC.1